jgi:hypothetical protein
VASEATAHDFSGHFVRYHRHFFRTVIAKDRSMFVQTLNTSAVPCDYRVADIELI